MLIEMLKQNQPFQMQPLDKQEIIIRLATEFEDNPLALYLTPEELQNKLNLGNKQQWFDFLNLDPVKNYIKTQMAHQSQIAQRKAFKSLQQQALDGNVQAVKEINELSGVMNQGDQNKTVVLHHIQRPKTIQTEVSK